jgi:alpha-tubulin suppressor-like RCC1 family protein
MVGGRGRARRGARALLALALLALTLLVPQNGIGAGAVATGGALSAWGDNGGGALGDGTLFDRDEPVHVTGTGPDGLAFIAIDAGANFSVGLLANGTAYAWGANTFGALGDNASGATYSATPIQVAGTGPGGIALVKIAAGNFFNLGLAANGTAYAWGDNRQGQLGNTTSGDGTASLVQVVGTGPGGIVLTDIAAGSSHSLGITANGTAYAWGYNEYGQLGKGDSGSGTNSTTPVQVSGTGPSGIALVALAGGSIHSLGLTANGTAHAWGNNDFGQLGDNSTSTRTTPVPITGTGPVGVALTAIDAGVYHSLGLTTNGTAYAWGRNQEGQIGDGNSGTGAKQLVPLAVPDTGPGGAIFTAIAAGGYHSLALTTSGTAYAWGWNQDGQIGNGTSGIGVYQTTPVTVSGTGPGGIPLDAIVGGGFHSLAGADGQQGNCAGFVDVPAADPACPAIASLTEDGVILGYAGLPPRFGPDDDVQRAQVAVFLVRALDWQNRPTGPRTFTDLGLIAAELRAASLIIANACDNAGNCVTRGYGDGRFGPTDRVSHAQVITLLARAFGLDPVQAWTPQPGGAQPHTGVPSVHDTDVRTYVHYAGTIPNAPTTAAGWNARASRAWVAVVLHQALTVQP